MEMTISVPDGKTIAWKELDGNTVAVLVDVDNRPVTERIRTFEDAKQELSRRAESGDETAAVLLADYESNADNIFCKRTKAYMRLCIIAAALNEGWEPKFAEDGESYYPCFFTKEEYDGLDVEKKRRVVARSCGASANNGIVRAYAKFPSSYSYTYFGSSLAFRTPELASYAGKQFIEEWGDFI